MNKTRRLMLKASDIPPAAEINKLAGRLALAAVPSILTVTVLQDYIHSQINHYSFYFSESLLFKSLWVCFPPLIFLQYIFFKKAYFNKPVSTISAVALPAIVHLFAIPLMISGFSALFFSHTYSFRQIAEYTLAEDLYKVVLIYALSALVMTRFFAKKPAETDTESLPFLSSVTETESLPKVSNIVETIVVTRGLKHIPIAVDDIYYLQAATPYIEIHLEHSRFLHNETLKSAAEKLNAKQFVRIHRSTIVNVKKVISYKSRLNGDYDLTLANGRELRLSRNYAAEFKEFYPPR